MSTVTVERINAVITADAGQLRREVENAITALKGLKQEAAKSLAIGGSGVGGGRQQGSARVAAVRDEESEKMRVRVEHMRDWRKLQADEVSRARTNAKNAAKVVSESQNDEMKQRMAFHMGSRKLRYEEMDAKRKAFAQDFNERKAHNAKYSADHARMVKEEIRETQKVANEKIRETNRAARAQAQIQAKQARAAVRDQQNEIKSMRIVQRDMLLRTRHAEREAVRAARSADIRGRRAVGWAGAGLAVGGGFIGKEVVRLAADFERTVTSFRVMIGQAAGTSLVKEMQVLAKETPLTTSALLDASRMLLGYGFAADKIGPALKRIGDISTGTGRPLQNLAMVYGQVRVAGKLMGQDLLQFINAGFNPLEEIAKKTGKSMSQLREEMHDGLITFDMVDDAFRSATSEGGRFFGMMNAQSKTLSGEWERLMDTLQIAGINIGMNLVDPLKMAVRTARELADTVSKVAKGEGSAVENTAVGVGAAASAVPIIALSIAAIKNAVDFLWKYIGDGLKTVSAAWTKAIAFILPYLTLATAGITAVAVALGVLAIKTKNLGKEILGDDAGFFASLGEGAKALLKELFLMEIPGAVVSLAAPNAADTAKTIAEREAARRKAAAADFGGGFGNFDDWTSDLVDQWQHTIEQASKDPAIVNAFSGLSMMMIWDSAYSGFIAQLKAGHDAAAKAIADADAEWEGILDAAEQKRLIREGNERDRAKIRNSFKGAFSELGNSDLFDALGLTEMLESSFDPNSGILGYLSKSLKGLSDTFRKERFTKILEDASAATGVSIPGITPTKRDEVSGELAGAFAKGSVEAYKIISQRTIEPKSDPNIERTRDILEVFLRSGIYINNIGVAP